MIKVFGADAVRTNSIMTVDGSGNPINPPLKFTLVDFMDKSGREFEIQFKVLSTNYDKEIIKFNKLLSIFKFN